MSMAYLGPSFDIHTGGVDLIFPHHEDEIAQSEAATGKPFVRTWLHCAHLQMGGAKMAKSIGNIARVGELLAAGVSPRALRYALISVHYRAALEYTRDSLGGRGSGGRAARRGSSRRSRRTARIAPTTRRSPTLLDAARERVRGGARRRPERLGRRSAAAVRPRPRAQPADRRVARLSTARRGAGAGGPARPRPGARRPARRGRAALDAGAPPRCSRRARPRARRGTGPAPTGCATSCARRGVAVEDTRDGQRWRRLEAGDG